MAKSLCLYENLLKIDDSVTRVNIFHVRLPNFYTEPVTDLSQVVLLHLQTIRRLV
jgi:hypothetical protein